MFTIYLTYAQPMNFYNGDEFGRVIPAGEERFLITLKDEKQAAIVTESWLRDPDVISIRIVREG